MKDNIIKVLDIWEKLKTLDLILGITIIVIFLFIAIFKSRARRTLLPAFPEFYTYVPQKPL